MSRELVGIIPACSINATANGVAVGQSLRIPVTPSNTAHNLTVGSSAPTAESQTIGNVEVTINKQRESSISWTGEEQLGLGGMAGSIMRDQYVQMMRTLVNEMEIDCAKESVISAMTKGNFVGTAGVTPFATNLNDLTKARKILSDNGSPMTDLQLALNTTAGMNMRNLQQLQKVNENGEDSLLRRGVLGNLFGFSIRESAGLQSDAVSANGYLSNGTASIGDTVITVDSGVGAIPKGSIITIADVNGQYVVAEDVVSGGTTIKLANKLEGAVEDNKAITVVSNTPNVGFARGSMLLVTRLPAVPQGGDMALDRTVITDPLSGISFEVALWGGARQNTITIASCWGVKNIKPEHSVAILG